VPNPVQVLVTNQTQRRDLAQDIAYTVDWVSNIVTIIPSVSAPPAANGDVLVINVFGLGGGNQLYKNSYNGADVGNQLNIPVAEIEIFEMAIFVNGTLINSYTYTSGTNNTTNILFGNTYTSTDEINVTAIGATDGSQLYSWSTPQTQYFVSTGQLDYMLNNAMTGTNIPNLVVEINGVKWLLDIKTSNSLHTSHDLQLSAYAQAWNELYEEKIERVGIIWLKSAKQKPDKKGDNMQGKGWEIHEPSRTIDENFKLFGYIHELYKLEHPNLKQSFNTFPTEIQINPTV
jgi:hypothetical protein